MHSAIFVAENPKPESLPHETSKWKDLLGELKRIESITPESILLAPNVLQIPLKNNLHSLIECGEQCRANEVYSYRVLFFSDVPEWITCTITKELA